MRRATQCRFPRHGPLRHFYPRSPCGERRVSRPIPSGIGRISIHALLAESDPDGKSVHNPATISIHALLAESDVATFWAAAKQARFLSTLSLRRATADERAIQNVFRISIHALLAESDASGAPTRPESVNFYPRSPCGERPRKSQRSGAGIGISIHALLAESDSTTIITICTVLRFLSTLSLRRATFFQHQFIIHHSLFLSTLSLRRATHESSQCHDHNNNFYPRSPCGERLSMAAVC